MTDVDRSSRHNETFEDATNINDTDPLLANFKLKTYDCITIVHPASTYIPNYNIIHDDLKIKEFRECETRSILLSLYRDKYKILRKSLPLPEKRLLGIPSERSIHWNNYVVPQKHFLYNESWLQDYKVPDNWFGPTHSSTC